MSRQVTAVYAEESTIARFSIDAQVTVHDLKQCLCSELAKKGERGYRFTNGFPQTLDDHSHQMGWPKHACTLHLMQGWMVGEHF
jgi:hypothetical protein